MKNEITLNANKDYLSLVQVPAPTASYAPVPHRDVINMTLEALAKGNLQVSSESYMYARNGQQAIGFYDINVNDAEMMIRLIWHNSYDKSMPLRWAIGASVIVCTNGMVYGDIGAFKRKHTGTVLLEYEEAVNQHVGKAYEVFENLTIDREKMKQIPINKQESAELVGRLFIEENIITITQLGIVKREIDHPTYQYNVENSLWELYNNVTVSLKEAHPRNSVQQHVDVHDFFTNEFFD